MSLTFLDDIFMSDSFWFSCDIFPCILAVCVFFLAVREVSSIDYKIWNTHGDAPSAFQASSP